MKQRATRGSGLPRGFTLIEVLVVIAIVGILASLLLATVGQAKSLAHSTQCKSNLKQLALALILYVHDNDGMYPASYHNGLNPSWQWEMNIGQYISLRSATMLESNGVFRCPSHVPLNPSPNQVLPANAALYLPSYGYNEWGNNWWADPSNHEPYGLGGISGGPAGGATTWFRPTRESQVRSPADMIALGDGYIAFAPPAAISPGSLGPMMESDLLGRDSASLGASSMFYVDQKNLRRRHSGFLNMAFCDGHVEDGRIYNWYFSHIDRDLQRWNATNLPK